MSSETGKRNSDNLNILGVVVVGICGAVLVYVSIALLQAYYMNDTAQVEVMADYGGQDSMQRSVKNEQLGHIEPLQGVRNANGTYVIKIERAMDLVVEDAKQDPSKLVPSQGPSNVQPKNPAYGRAAPAAPGGAAPAPAGGGADPGAGSAAPAAAAGAGTGSGSAAGGNGP